MLALGDTAYVEFCAIGKALDERLAALGGKRVVERVDCDLDFAVPAADWIGRAVKALQPDETGRGTVIEVDFGKVPAAPKTDIVEAEIVEHINLNSSRSGKETIHLALAFEGGVPAYEPGDSLDLYPENDPAEVDDLLRATGLANDQTLRAEFIKSRDIHTLSHKNLEAYAATTGHQYVKALIERGEVGDWIAGRQLIDLVTYFPIAITAEQLHALTRPLAPRAYSIASSRREAGDEVHLLVSAVRYESYGRSRKGVTSNQVAERLKNGDRLRVKLRPNRHFALPAPDRDVIMVGPGTGVAPFRAFVQERRATGAKGRNWLFFGDRHFTHDFLYQLEWQGALKDGALVAHGRRVLARPARENLRPGPALGAPWRPDRMARRRREFLCLRRRQRDGEGCPRHDRSRLCRGQIARSGGRRAGGDPARTRQALSTGHLLDHGRQRLPQ